MDIDTQDRDFPTRRTYFTIPSILSIDVKMERPWCLYVWNRFLCALPRVIEGSAVGVSSVDRGLGLRYCTEQLWGVGRLYSQEMVSEAWTRTE